MDGQPESTRPRHGGRRPGAGRKKRSAESVPHARRPTFDQRHPLHVTMRVARGVWNLRSQRAFRCVAQAFAAEKRQARLRIVHYSVQGNHLHLVAEADDPATLSSRMRGLTVRLARTLNRMMGRHRGRVFAERYHLHVLRTRSEVRYAIRYVLLNHYKHAAQAGRVGITVDPFSSGPWFEHWPPDVVRVRWSVITGPPPIAQPRSRLLEQAWRLSESMPGVRSSGAIANG